MCIGMNRREGVPGRTFVRDLGDSNWHNGLELEYDVVATANALHWLDERRNSRRIHACDDVSEFATRGKPKPFLRPYDLDDVKRVRDLG